RDHAMTDHLAPRPARRRQWLATAASPLRLRPLWPLLWPLLLPLLLAAASGPAAAAQPAAGSRDADARYQQESTACRDGSSPQDRRTCLKEAGAARAEARRQTLDNGESPAQLRTNALQRCQRVAADDRSACARMVQGGGQRSGSVAGGGMLMQITTADTPAPPASAASR
ncbi:MAG: hypothetical protein QE285_09315, partial [Aquabacterium sp.]|nr:hypothetical protein [Aquabacterium sp.]